MLLSDAVRTAVTTGCITEAEADAMTVPTYLRTRDEIEAPFVDPDADDDLDLVIEDHATFIAPDPAFAAYGVHGDVERFADDEVAQIRGWSGPSLAAALDRGRGVQGIEEATDALFSGIRAAVGADPERGHCDWTMSLLTAARPER
jgi:hypothetical protein